MLNLIIHIHVSTKAEKMMKIGLVLAEISMGYANFCRLVQTGEVVTLTISGVTGPILIKFEKLKM